MTIDTEKNMDNLDTEAKLSPEELDDLFDEPTEAKPKLSKQEIKDRLFCNRAYTGKKSFAEMVEIIKEHKGKEWEDIPLEARYGYALLNVGRSSKPSATGQNRLGYKPAGDGTNHSLTRTAIEWGNLFYTTTDEEGVLQTYRLDDSKRVPITCSFFMPPQTFELIEDLMDAKDTNVVNIGIIFNAEVTITPLTQQARRELYLQMQGERRDNQGRDMTFNPEDMDEAAFTSWSATVNNVFIDEKTIVPAALVNLSLSVKPEELLVKMTQSTIAGFDANRQIRRQQVMSQDRIKPQSSSPDPLNQMDAVAEAAAQGQQVDV
jgi:hypothetical protein